MVDDYYEANFNVRIRRDKETDQIVLEAWHNDQGQPHRNGDLPAFIKRDKSGFVTYQRWQKIGITHRMHKPAILSFYPETKVLMHEAWRINGQPHRDGDFPSDIWRDKETGNIYSEEYYKNGRRHRDNGPAVIEYDPVTKEIIKQEFWRNDRQVLKRKPSGLHCK